MRISLVSFLQTSVTRWSYSPDSFMYTDHILFFESPWAVEGVIKSFDVLYSLTYLHSK